MVEKHRPTNRTVGAGGELMNLRAWISDQIEGDGMNDSNLDSSAR